MMLRQAFHLLQRPAGPRRAQRHRRARSLRTTGITPAMPCDGPIGFGAPPLLAASILVAHPALIAPFFHRSRFFTPRHAFPRAPDDPTARATPRSLTSNTETPPWRPHLPPRAIVSAALCVVGPCFTIAYHANLVCASHAWLARRRKWQGGATTCITPRGDKDIAG